MRIKIEVDVWSDEIEGWHEMSLNNRVRASALRGVERIASLQSPVVDVTFDGNISYRYDSEDESVTKLK